MILGIDPGTRTSGAVLFVERTSRVVWADKAIENERLRQMLLIQGWTGREWASMGPSDQWNSGWRDTEVVIEALSPRGQIVGWDTFTTILWVGRLFEAASSVFRNVHLIHRDDIKRQLIGRSNIKGADAHLRQYLLDTIGPKGKKAAPGPTYGVAGHAWQALAAVQCYRERRAENAA